MVDLSEFDTEIATRIATTSRRTAEKITRPTDVFSSIGNTAERIAYEMQDKIGNFRKKTILGLNFFLATTVGQRLLIRDDLQKAFSHLDSSMAINALVSNISSHTPLASLIGLSDMTLEVLYETAKTSFDLNQYEHSDALFTFFIFLDCTRSCAWVGLGHCQYHLERYELAINAYLMAQSLDPSSYWTPIFMANCFIAQENFIEAYRLLEQAQAHYLASGQKELTIDVALSNKIIYVKNRAKK